MEKLFSTVGALTIIMLVIAIILFFPFLFIYSTNSLFGLSIEYTIWNWFMALVFLTCVRGGGSTYRSKKD